MLFLVEQAFVERDEVGAPPKRPGGGRLMRTRLSFTWFFIGDSDEKSKKGTKRKKPPPAAIENDFLPKRRSARVRNGKCLCNLSGYVIYNRTLPYKYPINRT